MMATMTSEGSPTPCVKETCVFLTEYGARLLAAGATCIRIEKNVSRMAHAYGMSAEMTVMPRHIHLTLTDIHSGDMITSTAAVRDTGANFAVNTGLSRLSWEIADGRIDFGEALRRYHDIITSNRQNPWGVLLLVSLANAAFCRLFGGDVYAMAITGMATLAGFRIRQLLLGRSVDIRLVFIICSFVSSVLGATGILFSIGSTPAIALGTSVLYLVPGIPFLNSFSDMLCRHYLCAFSRFADALVLTCCLSIGLCAGVWLMNANMF